MSDSLYDLLGVAPDASTVAIHRAYRRAAKAAHPDAGGSPEAFARLKLAHDVLTDPAKRARYDQDGTIAESVPDTRDAQAWNLITAMLDQAEEYNLIDSVRMMLVQRERQSRQTQQQAFAMAAKWKRLEKKFSRKSDGENMLAAITRGKVEQANDLAKRCAADIEQCKRCVELLSDYTFEMAAGLGQTPPDMLPLIRSGLGSMW